MKKIRAILAKDPQLAAWLDRVKLEELQKQNGLFQHLIRSIIAQQLSTKAARTIESRFEQWIESRFEPRFLMSCSPEFMREAGISHQKANYIIGASEAFAECDYSDEALHKMDDATLIRALTSIKGVGPWTAEMMLIFAMARTDVFPVDDLGIQQSMASLYGWKDLSKKELKSHMIRQAERWRPYRSYATLLLWKIRDGAYNGMGGSAAT
ncbi:MAG: DNA-3-methyladenine glycosylase family protein [Flavobacteriales bacterium]